MSDINGAVESSQGAEVTCQFCTAKTSPDYNFCTTCFQQIKCIECEAKVFPNATFCLKCSRPLVPKTAFDKAPNRATRRVKKEGENYEEETDFALSDIAVEKLAPYIIGTTMPGVKRPSVPPIKTLGSGQDEIAEFEDVSTETENADSGSAADNSVNSTATSRSQAVGSLAQFFKKDNGALVAIENDFKGKNWKEQQQNFIILYTKAHTELLGKPVANKEVIREAAKRLKITDANNFTSYLSKVTADCMTELTEGLELNKKGEKEVARIIQAMEDDKVPAGYSYADRPMSTQSSKKPNRLNKDDKSEIDGWTQEGIPLGNLDIRDIKIGRDAALFSIWALTIHLQKSKAISTAAAYYYLNKKFTTISVTPEAFSLALFKNKGAEKWFQKNGDGEYFLSTDGQKLVEGWISGTVKIKKEESE